MRLAGLVWDAVDPERLGAFWRAALPGTALELRFEAVPEPPSEPLRLHLDLYGGPGQDAVVARLLELGASHLDIGQRDAPWTVLADPEGNAFCVVPARPVFSGADPVAALPLDCADPARDEVFWAWLSGWAPVGGEVLRHPGGAPLLGLCDEPEPHAGPRNRLRPLVRVESPEAVGREVVARGGRSLGDDVYAAPSGNELHLLLDAG